MEPHDEAIVEIPANRVKYFGTTGKMLLPSPAAIEAILNRIPQQKLITTELLRDELAEEFEVEAVCPVTTQKSLKALARDTTHPVAYWRVLKKNGELMTYFPGGAQAQADHLKQEGFTIDAEGKKPKVSHFADSLIDFDEED